MAKEKKKKTSFWKEFKAFISRGSILDMAVGVVIGSAFGAIVTALVNILLSVCLWAVPGGLKGLVTVLPAINSVQEGMNKSIGLGQKFAAADLHKLGTALAEANYAEQIAGNPDYLSQNPNLIESSKGTILSKYTLHGTKYTYNMSAVIDWGAFINAVISFIIIALVLFIIVKVAKAAHEARMNMTDDLARAQAKQEKGLPLSRREKKALALKAEADAKAAEEEAEKQRLAEEAAKNPTPEIALLMEIRDALVNKKSTKVAEAKATEAVTEKAE